MGRKNRILRYFKKFGKKYANHPYVVAKLEKAIEVSTPTVEEKLEESVKEEVKPVVKKSAIKKTTTRKKTTAKTSRAKRSKPKAE